MRLQKWVGCQIHPERRLTVKEEKIFTKKGYLNTKNDVIWSDSRIETNKAEGVREKEKFPLALIVTLGAT